MKARSKITLWTASFTLTVAICFSSLVFYELVEQPFRVIDDELQDIAEVAAQTISSSDTPQGKQDTLSRYPYDKYWIKVVNDQGITLLASPMTRYVDIPARSDKKFSFVRKNLPLEKLWLAPEDHSERKNISASPVVFRVLTDRKVINGKIFELQVANPIPFLMHELAELVYSVLAGLVLITIIAIAVSYYLAGKILQPLASINNLIKNISDNSLDQRIPLEKNKDELYILTRSLNSMFDRLQFSFNRQKEFIGNASHELKSPLTILMLGHEEMLAGELPQTVRTGLEKHLITLRRLSKLVRNLLEISRLEQQETLRHETIHLHELIDHVLDEFKDLLQSRNIVLETDLSPVTFVGDAEKILQMVINLFDNAIKYNAPQNGRIWIATQKTRECIRLSIANTGPIIPEQDLPKVFEQFFRVERSRSATFGGSGLGLTIVKQIVELHQGTISVTSSAEGITRFTVDFPLPTSSS